MVVEVNQVNSLVIFASRHGNTRKVAEVIARVLRSHGTSQLMSADEAPAVFAEPLDLVIVGGPTEAHRMTGPVALFLNRVAPGALDGVAAAAFDTRVRMPRWLSGSAGAGIARGLERAGARLIAPEESFFVKGVNPKNTDTPVLEAGELGRAAVWAASLDARLLSKVPA